MANLVFYIANGEYIKEAQQSAQSLLKVMPDTELCLMTFDKNCQADFDYIFNLDYLSGVGWYQNSIMAFNRIFEMGYDKYIYLDTDTYICEDFSEVWRWLDDYDFIATYAPGRVTTGTTLDVYYPEIHVGFCAFRSNQAVKFLFSQWLSQYRDNRDIYRDNDQGALRDVLHTSYDVRLMILPPEYCFRYKFGGFLSGACKVLHGREGNLAQIAQLVNNSTKMRTFQKGWYRGV
jgi:hypothetical protein